MAEFQLDPNYNEVPDRIIEFRAKYPEGTLRPLNPDTPFDVVIVEGHAFIAYAAAAYRTPDDPCPGVGVAWEPFPGKTPYTKDSELQNAETSAWGRALIAVGAADARKGVASAEEVRNRKAAEAAAAAAHEVAVDPELVAVAREAVRLLMEDHHDAGAEAWARYKAATSPPWPYTVEAAHRIIDFVRGFRLARGEADWAPPAPPATPEPETPEASPEGLSGAPGEAPPDALVNPPAPEADGEALDEGHPGPCTFCGSTRSQRVLVGEVIRCARANDCRKRAEERAAAKAAEELGVGVEDLPWVAGEDDDELEGISGY